MLHYNAFYVLYVIGIFLEINIYFLDIIALHSDYWKKIKCTCSIFPFLPVLCPLLPEDLTVPTLEYWLLEPGTP